MKYLVLKTTNGNLLTAAVVAESSRREDADSLAIAKKAEAPAFEFTIALVCGRVRQIAKPYEVETINE